VTPSNLPLQSDERVGRFTPSPVRRRTAITLAGLDGSDVSTAPLGSLKFSWLGIHFDPSNGRGLLCRRPVNIRGFAHWTRFRWHALWNNGNRLCLQVGARQWFADEGWTASVTRHGPIRIFRLVRGTDQALKRTYSVSGWEVLSAIFDDPWAGDDFYSWATTIWSDRSQHQYFLGGPWQIRKS